MVWDEGFSSLWSTLTSCTSGRSVDEQVSMEQGGGKKQPLATYFIARSG